MSRPHTISKESTTAEIARHGTKRPNGKKGNEPPKHARMSRKSCHRSCSRQTLYPLTEFRSSIPFCFRVALFVLRLAVFILTFLFFFCFSLLPSFKNFFFDDFQVCGQEGAYFQMSSNTFFVQNYSQHAHASFLKGMPMR